MAIGSPVGAAFKIIVPGSPGCAVPTTVVPSFRLNGNGTIDLKSWPRSAT